MQGSHHSVSCNEQTCENNHDRAGGFGLTVLVGEGAAGLRIWLEDKVANGAEDHEAHKHPGGSPHEGTTSSSLFHDEQTWECHSEVDGAENDGRDVAVSQANGLEDRCAVVYEVRSANASVVGLYQRTEEEVGSSQLLQSLHNNTKKSAVGHARSSEDLVPLGLASSSELSIVFGLDLAHLAFDFPVMGGHTIRARNGGASSFDVVVAVVPAWRFGKEDDTRNHKDRRYEADAHGNSPG